jgi:hypothetical protein
VQHVQRETLWPQLRRHQARTNALVPIAVLQSRPPSCSRDQIWHFPFDPHGRPGHGLQGLAEPHGVAGVAGRCKRLLGARGTAAASLCCWGTWGG